MSLKHIAIGIAITLWALSQLISGISYRAFLWTVVVVGVLWVLEQFVPRFTSVERPARKSEV